MADLGKVGIVTKGAYNPANTYETLDAVYYLGETYLAKQNVPANTAPTNTTYWQKALGQPTGYGSPVDVDPGTAYEFPSNGIFVVKPSGGSVATFWYNTFAFGWAMSGGATYGTACVIPVFAGTKAQYTVASGTVTAAYYPYT